MEKIKSIIIASAIIIAVGLIGYIAGRNHFRDATKMVQIDTLVVRDTVTIEKPIPVQTTNKEIVYVAVHDTTRIRDTLYIMLQKESKTYSGEDYTARVSGYEPSLDFIEVYPKTTVISKTEAISQKLSPWRYEITVGLDYGWMWQNYITPNFGVEIGYKRISIGAECGLNMDLINNTFQSPMPYLQASVKYRLFGR